MIASSTEIFTYLGKSSPTSQDNALVALLQKSVEASIKRYLGYDPEQAQFTEILPGAALYRYVEMSLATFDVIGNSNRAANWLVDQQRIQVRQVPLRQVISVFENPAAYGGDAPDAFTNNAYQLTEGTDFYVDWDTLVSTNPSVGVCRSGLLVRYGTWPSSPRTVQVTYLAGYTADEFNGVGAQAVDASPIKQAILMQFAKEYSAALGSITQGGAGAVQSLHLADYSVAFQQGLNGWTTGLMDSVKQLLSPFRNLGTRLI